MRGLSLNFASTHQTENPRGFSEVGENKQLLIAIVVHSFYSNSSIIFTMLIALIALITHNSAKCFSAFSLCVVEFIKSIESLTNSIADIATFLKPLFFLPFNSDAIYVFN
ncbi:MAG: hypothetical protein CL596_04760 [Alteromonas sp.]|nr:hypothetical protein [Alteromonas sp.]MAY22285.1 hypothetical protein [Flavobacteriaceae bacterium]